MSLDQCRCGFLFLLPGDRSRHVCPPLWDVWCPERHDEREEDARPVYATDGRTAAAEWARLNDQDSAEYDIASGDALTVCVAPAGSPNYECFRAEGAMEPNYWATPVKEPTE